MRDVFKICLTTSQFLVDNNFFGTILNCHLGLYQ